MVLYLCNYCLKTFKSKTAYTKHQKCKRIKYIDLCSGIGGFRIALQNYCAKSKSICFECILSADVKQDAIDTYNLNFNTDNKSVDINKLNPLDIGEFSLLCAGFPCQPYSCAGQKQGFDDSRSGIIFRIFDICKVHKPKFIILENVYNLLSLDNGKCIEKIKTSFEEMGYFVNYTKLNSSDFGCPQSRERVYIVCSLENEVSFNNINKLQGKVLKDVIDYNDTFQNIETSFAKKLLDLHKKSPIYGYKMGDKRGGKTNIHSWTIGYNGCINLREIELMNSIMTQRRKKHWAKKKNIIWMDGMPLSFEEITTFFEDKDLQTMLDNLVSKKYLRLEKCKDLIAGKRVYKEDSEEGYNICKGKLSFPVSHILNPNAISPTLTATDSHKLAVIIGENVIRKLNTTELKKICGFPHSYKIPEHVNAYDLFGNMATPPVIEAILEILY